MDRPVFVFPVWSEQEGFLVTVEVSSVCFAKIKGLCHHVGAKKAVPDILHCQCEIWITDSNFAVLHKDRDKVTNTGPFGFFPSLAILVNIKFLTICDCKSLRSSVAYYAIRMLCINPNRWAVRKGQRSTVPHGDGIFVITSDVDTGVPVDTFLNSFHRYARDGGVGIEAQGRSVRGIHCAGTDEADGQSVTTFIEDCTVAAAAPLN